ncbi:MAG: hypothetical protein AAGI63_03470 [Planctomycetota bacterium]
MASDELDRSLCWYEQLALAGHRLTCRPCRKLKVHLRQLRKLIQLGEQSGQLPAGSELKLSMQRKCDIQCALKELTAEDK